MDLMNVSSVTRRDLILGGSMAAAAAAILPSPALGQDRANASRKPAATFSQIGLFPRGFGRLGLKTEALFDAIKAAGYQRADLIPMSGGAGRGPDTSTTEAVTTMKAALSARGLTSGVGNLRIPEEVPLADAIAAARRAITNAHALGETYVLSLGTEYEEGWVQFCKVLADAAAFGQELGVQVVIKDHHGLNNTAGELVGWLQQVNHPNFGLFWDPGNLIYYTGKDPLKQLEIVAPYVTGIIAKDCTNAVFQTRTAGDPPFGDGPPAPGNGEVMIQFGTGKVDFVGMYRKLKSLGFHGPTVVEGMLPGKTVEETIANARAQREFLERVMAGV
jgi:sugar phosphate isomerase/epimerase